MPGGMAPLRSVAVWRNFGVTMQQFSDAATCLTRLMIGVLIGHVEMDALNDSKPAAQLLMSASCGAHAMAPSRNQ
eukprot:3066423-Pyramimonas_sp.AAC.1